MYNHDGMQDITLNKANDRVSNLMDNSVDVSYRSEDPICS
jgi:hypothetical protein